MKQTIITAIHKKLGHGLHSQDAVFLKLFHYLLVLGGHCLKAAGFGLSLAQYNLCIFLSSREFGW